MVRSSSALPRLCGLVSLRRSEPTSGAPVPFHLLTQQLTDDGGSSLCLGSGLLVQPGDDITRESDGDRRSHVARLLCLRRVDTLAQKWIRSPGTG
jgi:hypothetical protein